MSFGELVFFVGGLFHMPVNFINTYLPMPKCSLMLMDHGQSSVRALKSSTEEDNSHQYKLPKEDTNVPPTGILKVSPMLSGKIPA